MSRICTRLLVDCAADALRHYFFCSVFLIARPRCAVFSPLLRLAPIVSVDLDVVTMPPLFVLDAKANRLLRGRRTPSERRLSVILPAHTPTIIWHRLAQRNWCRGASPRL